MPTATALWFRAPGVVETGPVDLAGPGPGQVQVRTIVSGISGGTELLAYRGQLPPDLALDEALPALAGARFTFPFRYGYSCVGRVERSGPGVPAGSLVFAYHPHQDVFVAPASSVVVLDEGTDPRRATLFPLVETALQVTLDAGPVTLQPVAVLGLGTVGLLTGALLARAGAHVVAAEPRPWRRQVAGRLGVDACDPAEMADRVSSATGGRGVALVVEASGDPGTLAGALDLLAHEGEVLVASWYGTRPATLPLGGAFHRRRLAVRSTQVSTIPALLGARWTIDRRRAVAGALLGQLPLDELATHEFPFTGAGAAFAAVDRGQEGLVHAALRYA
ncbi:MAG: zinc-binding alcohol dehydrogenase [Actinobacteria bacterium]|nr:zinc-binding alcohol dehydrogenase [Actinomycetota bacterium]